MNSKHPLRHKARQKKGFTLIELIIVAAILALLAIVILSVFNPLEQINRARDTGTLETTAQTYTAAVRNMVVKQAFPFEESVTSVSLSSAEGQQFLTKLQESGDIKGSLFNNNDLNNIFVTADVDKRAIVLCFNPQSNAYKNHPLGGFDKAGQPATNCQDQQCYVCINGDNIAAVQQDAAQPSVIPTVTPGVTTIPTPTPTPVSIVSWYRATSGNSCNDYCASLGKSCTDAVNSCPAFCFATAGGNQVEARWANIFGITDPATGYSCWGHYSCATAFKYKPLQFFNARCCCR